MVQPTANRFVTEASAAATFLPKWKPSTDYTAGQSVVNPSGDVVTSKTTHTSGSSFNPANWNLSASYASKVAGVKAPTVLLVGDSITAQCGKPSTLDTLDAYSARGFFNWANWLMGERYQVVGIAGIGGQTSLQISQRIASDMAAAPSEWVVLECGTNDVAQDRSYTDIVASMTACLDAIQAAGRRCCIVTVWPSNNYTTTARKQIAAQVSRWITGLPATRPGVVVADAYSALVDPATGMLGAGMTFDNVVHPGSAAAYRVGAKVAAAMTPFAPPLPALRVPDIDTVAAIGNQAFLTNGSGWTLDIGTGATYTRNPNTFGNMATATVAAGGVQFGYQEALGPRVNIGDVIQARARIRWSGLTWSAATTKFSPYINFLIRSAGSAQAANPGAGSVGFEPSSFDTTFGVDDVAASGDVILTSTKVTIPATATDATPITRFYPQIGFRSTNLTGGTVTISDVSVYKTS